MRSFTAVTLVTSLLAPLPARGQAEPAPAILDTGALATAIRARAAGVAGAEVAVSYRDLQSGRRVDVNGHTSFHAASTMKVPVMLEVLRATQEARLSLDQGILLVNQFRSIVDGSRYSLDPAADSDSSMYARVGERVPVRELLERMIVRSSNLATNALIALVGADRANETAHALGATEMHVLRGVEDQKAFDAGLINTTTSADLATLLERIERGDALSAANTRLMREILLHQELNDEIPAGLPPGTPVAHKTGSITGTLHDAAIVYPANGTPYVLVVLTRGIPDQTVARQMIVDISRLVWEQTMVAR